MSNEVIQALMSVPEKRLLLVQLANELVGPNGELDYEKAVERTPEVNLAVAEANAYARATQEALRALTSIPARAETIQHDLEGLPRIRCRTCRTTSGHHLRWCPRWKP